MKKILLVDDSVEMISMMNEFMLEAGFESRVAHSGLMAFKLLQEESFDLVITDIEMADGDGFWLLAATRTLPCPPLVIMASGSSAISEEKVLGAGAVAFFRKPFDIGPLMERVASLWGAEQI